MMKHLKRISHAPAIAGEDPPPIDIQFIIDILVALLDKKEQLQS